MEQIEQLRAMRDAARARLEATPDHRLMTSLTALIEDLEAAFGGESSDSASEPAQEPESPAQESAAQPGDRETSSFAQVPPLADEAPPVDEETVPEETVVIVETVEEIDPGQIDFDEIELEISPQDINVDDIETVIAAEVLSMNGDAVAGSLSETAEDAVNRALDELSIDLADTLAAEPSTGYKR